MNDYDTYIKKHERKVKSEMKAVVASILEANHEVDNKEAIVNSIDGLFRKFYCSYKKREISIIKDCPSCPRLYEPKSNCEYDSSIIKG